MRKKTPKVPSFRPPSGNTIDSCYNKSNTNTTLLIRTEPDSNMSLIFTQQILLAMYSDVVQRTLVYLKQIILKQGFLFSFFSSSWRDKAATTFCFLTLASRRFIVTGDSIFAPSLPAWVFRGWEGLLTFRAWLYGEENFLLLSRCPENCLFVQLESFSLTIRRSCV